MATALGAAAAVGLTGCTGSEQKPSAPGSGGAGAGGRSDDIVLAPGASSMLAGNQMAVATLPTGPIADKRIATPHLWLSVLGLGVATQLDGMTASQLKLPGVTGAQITQRVVPAPGEELIWVQLQADGALFPPQAGSTPTLGIRTATTTHSLPLGAYNTAVQSYANNHLLAVVSVPAGQPVDVVVDDLDLTARYDVRTGTHATDADTGKLAAAATLRGVKASPKTAKWAGGWTDGRNADLMKVEWHLDADDPYLGSWVPGQGWAPKGRTWLALPYRPSYTAELFTDMTIDLHDDVWIKVDSKRYRADTKTKVTALSWMTTIDTQWLVFSVPDDFSKGTLEVQFPATLRVKYRDGQKRTWPNRGAGRRLTATLTRTK